MYALRLFYMPEKTVVLPLAHADVLQGIFYSLLSSEAMLSSEIHDKPTAENAVSIRQRKKSFTAAR